MKEELADAMKKCEGLLIQAQASSILDSNQDLTKDMSKLSITSDKRVSQVVIGLCVILQQVLTI